MHLERQLAANWQLEFSTCKPWFNCKRNTRGDIKSNINHVKRQCTALQNQKWIISLGYSLVLEVAYPTMWCIYNKHIYCTALQNGDAPLWWGHELMGEIHWDKAAGQKEVLQQAEWQACTQQTKSMRTCRGSGRSLDAEHWATTTIYLWKLTFCFWQMFSRTSVTYAKSNTY